jgi:hypothetical protein
MGFNSAFKGLRDKREGKKSLEDWEEDARDARDKREGKKSLEDWEEDARGHVRQLGSGMQLLQGEDQVQRGKRVGIDCLDVKGEDMGIKFYATFELSFLLPTEVRVCSPYRSTQRSRSKFVDWIWLQNA